MGDTIWLGLQALGTMAVVIVVALVSSKRTRQMLASRWPRKPSALARATPDPQFQPDPEVTDPFHVTDAHHEPASSRREQQQMVDRAQAASVEHPSAVEQLDGLVEPADGSRRDEVRVPDSTTSQPGLASSTSRS